MPKHKLADTTYDTVATLKLTVADMLTLTNALYDAINWNEHKDWPALANMVRDLQVRIDLQTRPYIDIADRKLRAAKLTKTTPTGEEPTTLQRLPHPDDYRD
jgi:hypothetical protein